MIRYSGVSGGAAVSSGAFVPEISMSEVIQSRFGEIMVDVERAVAFPNGLLGMPDKSHFILANFSSPKMEQFTLLQSLDDTALSFITLPLEINNSIISAADIRGAADDLQIKYDDLAILLIVSVHRSPDKIRLSANARAPLFIDVKRKVGAQYVFQNDHYKVQSML